MQSWFLRDGPQISSRLPKGASVSEVTKIDGIFSAHCFANCVWTLAHLQFLHQNSHTLKWKHCKRGDHSTRRSASPAILPLIRSRLLLSLIVTLRLHLIFPVFFLFFVFFLLFGAARGFGTTICPGMECDKWKPYVFVRTNGAPCVLTVHFILVGLPLKPWHF